MRVISVINYANSSLELQLTAGKSLFVYRFFFGFDDWKIVMQCDFDIIIKH